MLFSDMKGKKKHPCVNVVTLGQKTERQGSIHAQLRVDPYQFFPTGVFFHSMK